MSYAAAVDHLYALGHELAPTPSAPRRKFDLAHMRVLAAALGDPQTTFPSVLIAGTNGKGSTSATLASILTASGYKTGLYTSPHLVDLRERWMINGATIEPAMLDSSIEILRRASEKIAITPTYFEALTLIAFIAFREVRC